MASLCFASSCRELKKADAAAELAVREAEFKLMRGDAIEKRLLLDRPNFMDALLDVLHTHLISSSLRDTAELPLIDFLSGVSVKVSHTSIFCLISCLGA